MLFLPATISMLFIATKDATMNLLYILLVIVVIIIILLLLGVI